MVATGAEASEAVSGVVGQQAVGRAVVVAEGHMEMGCMETAAKEDEAEVAGAEVASREADTQVDMMEEV